MKQRLFLALLMTIVGWAAGAQEGETSAQFEVEKARIGSDKVVALRSNPLGLALGMANVTADFGVGTKWTLGPNLFYTPERDIYFSGNLADFNNTRVGFFGGGLRANYYFTGTNFSHGWYLGPSVNYLKINVRDDYVTKSATGYGGGLLVGHQWQWSYFRINLGVGGLYLDLPEEIVLENQTSSGTRYRTRVKTYRLYGFNSEATIGVAF